MFAQFQRTRRIIKARLVPYRVVLGDESDNVYAGDGMYWVRPYANADESDGSTLGAPFRVRAGSNIIVPRAGFAVWIGHGPDRRLTVQAYDHDDLIEKGINPTAIQPNDPYRQWIRLKDVQNFRALPIGTTNSPSMLVQVRQLFYYTATGDLVRWNGTNADTHIDLAAYVPADGLQRYVVLWLRTYNPNGLSSIQVTVSTPIDSIDDVLGFDALQECADAADADTTPIQAFRLANAQTALVLDDTVDVDLRQVFNMPQVYGFPNTVRRSYRVHEDFSVMMPYVVDIVDDGLVQIQDGGLLVIFEETADAGGSSSGSAGITQLTGDVLAGPGSGAQTASIAAKAVGLSKVADGTPFKYAGWNVAGVFSEVDLPSGTATTTRSVPIPNGDFEVWENGTAAAPDNWAITGSGATIARESSGTLIKHGLYSAKLTRVGNDATLMRDIYVPAGSTYVRSRDFTYGGWAYATAASTTRLRIDDGVTVSQSAYHTGGSTWEWLTITVTVGASVTQLKVGFEVVTTNTSSYLDAVGIVEGNLMTAGYYAAALNGLLRHADIDAKQHIVLSGAAFTTDTGSAQIYGRVFQFPAAINNSFENEFTVAAGSYTLSMFGEKNNDRGISTIYIDDVSQGTLDWYNSTPQLNIYQTLACTVIGDGRHVLKVIMATKHASSTNYYLIVPMMFLRQSAY